MHAGRIRPTHLVVLGALVTAFIGAVFASPARAAYPGTNGEIVSTQRLWGEDDEIVKMASEPNAPRVPLTDDPAHDHSPVVSPDGTKIAFVRGVFPHQRIWIMNIDGSNERRMTSANVPEVDPTWSPQGKRVAYWADVAGNKDIYASNVDGTCGPRRLTEHAGADTDPAWSPDGTTIAFETPRDNNAEIWAMNADGSNERNLTNTGTDTTNIDPSWSPSSASIAFSRDAGDFDVMVMDADGTDVANLTDDSGQSGFEPTYSPDGASVAFKSGRDGNFEIYTATTTGATQVRLTNDAALPPTDSQPDWAVASPAAPAADAPYTCPPPLDEPDPTNTGTTNTGTGGGDPAPPGPIVELLPPTARGISVERKKLRTVLSRGLVVRARCDQPCRLRGRLVVPAKLARKLRLGRRARSVVVARGSAQAAGGATARVRLRFTRAAKRRLRRVRSVKLKLIVTPSAADGRTGASTTRTVKLRR